MQLMRLVRASAPFDRRDFIYELKLDGFRAAAFVEQNGCRLFSRNGREFKRWPALTSNIASVFRGRTAVVDGELVCFSSDGRPQFYDLLAARQEPVYCAFDLLAIDGRDLRGLTLIERKRRLRAILRDDVASRVVYVDHIRRAGRALYGETCRLDLEGVVGKWGAGTYQTGSRTSWLKFKNPRYSQAEGRHELFESQRSRFEGRVHREPTPVLDFR